MSTAKLWVDMLQKLSRIQKIMENINDGFGYLYRSGKNEGADSRNIERYKVFVIYKAGVLTGFFTYVLWQYV